MRAQDGNRLKSLNVAVCLPAEQQDRIYILELYIKYDPHDAVLKQIMYITQYFELGKVPKLTVTFINSQNFIILCYLHIRMCLMHFCYVKT